VRREAGFGQGGADVQLELVPGAERHHGADYQHAAGALVVVRAGPDLAPYVAGDHVLGGVAERGLSGVLLVDPGLSQHLAADGHAAGVLLLVVHGCFLAEEWIARSSRAMTERVGQAVRKPSTVSV